MSTSLDSISAAVGSATIASGNNTGIVWNWANTTNSTVAFTLGETSAATGGTSTSGVPNQVLLKLATVAASTQSPLSVFSRAAHVFSVSPTAAQLLAADGSNSAPTYSFAANTNSGMVNIGGDIYFSNTGIYRFAIGGVGPIMMSGTIFQCINGSAGAPVICDSSTNQQGIYFPSGAIGLTAGGGEIGRFNSTSLLMTKKIYPATDASATQTATGIYGNTGAPNNANGADGDFYFRADGGAGTTIYQRRAGTWTGVV